MPQGTATSSTRRPGALGGFVYWLLLLMGFATLAPCVLLPEWHALQAIHEAEQIQEARTETIASMVTAQRRSLERLQRDPAAMTRLAQRDLRYRRADCRSVHVAELEATVHTVAFDAVDVLAAEEPKEPVQIEPVSPPAWLARRLTLLPDYDYDGIFCDPQKRPIIMTLSVSLIGLAFVLFGRRTTGNGG